jgi:hypothetical protein
MPIKWNRFWLEFRGLDVLCCIWDVMTRVDLKNDVGYYEQDGESNQGKQQAGGYYLVPATK